MVFSMQGNCSKCSGRPCFSRHTTASRDAVKDSHRPEISFITSTASLDFMMGYTEENHIKSKSALFKVIPYSHFYVWRSLDLQKSKATIKLSQSLGLHAIPQLRTRTWDVKHVRALSLMKGKGLEAINVLTEIIQIGMARNNSRSARNWFFARDTKNRQSPWPLVISSATLLIANLRLQWDHLI